MSQDVIAVAHHLAAQPYALIVQPDVTNEGESVYIAYHPELSDCIAQGNTVEEAITELAEMRFEFILWLLEDGLPVPPPSPQSLSTTSDHRLSIVADFEPTKNGMKNHLPHSEGTIWPGLTQLITTPD
ncbi:MAG: type II toxin-antitoxin system HicB family antitoxin [Aggregatilineales bacterium]